MANLGQKEFDARIKRINNPRNNSYYDPDLQMHVPKRVTRAKIEKPKSAGNEMLSAFLVSMVIGAFGLFLAQIVRVKFLGMTGFGNPVVATDMLIGLWMVLLLSALLKRRAFLARFAQVVGLGLMLTAGHNLVFKWPEAMAKIYSPAYVAAVQAVAKPQSLVVRGAVYALP